MYKEVTLVIRTISEIDTLKNFAKSISKDQENLSSQLLAQLNQVELQEIEEIVEIHGRINENSFFL